MTPIRILIADDHQIIVDGLRRLLEDQPEIQFVDWAPDGEALLRKLEEHDNIHVVVMDVNMKPMDGITTTEILAKHHKYVKVLALTMYDDEEYLTKMLAAGAKGYVLKNANKAEMLKAIQTVAKGGTHFSEGVTSMIISRFMQKH